MQEAHILLVMDYLEGNWDTQKEAQLQALIACQELDQEELHFWQQMYEQTGSLPFPAPSDRLKHNFYALLDAETKADSNNIWQMILGWLRANPAIRLSQLVAGMLILAVGMAIGYFLSPSDQYKTQISSLSGEVQQMREVMVLTLIDQSSAIQRLKAVSITNDLKQADATIYEALLKTLNKDPQVNVRLAALEALLQYTQDATVREGLIQAIAQQDSPLVQIALANAMVRLQEPQAVSPLQNLLKQEDLNQDARQTIENSIKILL